MRKPAHLAFDLGAETGRALLGVLAGGRLQLHEVDRFPNIPQSLPTGLHWDFEGLWAKVREGLGQAARMAEREGWDLRSVGVDTWGVDYGLLDAEGRLVEPPHCYRDPRNLPVFGPLMERLGPERLYEVTGIQFMPLNTLFQLAAARTADQGLLERARRLLFMPDLFHHRLCGSEEVERSIASTSQLLDARTGTWALPLLEEVGLPTHLLGEIVEAGTPLGSLRPEVAEHTCAPPALPVVAPAAHDTASAVAAVPAEEGSTWCYLSSGTWSLLGAELDGPCTSAAARAVPFTNEVGVGGKVRFLKNIIGLWLVQEVRRALAEAGTPLDYDELTALAEAAEPFRALVANGWPPLAEPGGMPEKLRGYARATGQPEPDTPGRLVRCCLESLALTYARVLDQLESVLGRRFEVLHVVGGGSRNGLLNRMTADATGRLTLVGPAEATAVGNLLVQAMGCGEVADPADLRRIVHTSFPTETIRPRPDPAWDRARERFAALPDIV
jgi:rhamnulokinase